MFIEIKNAKITKISTRFSPEIKLAESAPKIDPKTIPKAHFFTIFKFVFFNFRCDLIDEIDVKHITPRDEATAKCITTSEAYPSCNKIKYVTGTIIIPPPTPSKPATKPEASPVNKKINTIIVNEFSVFKV